MELISSVGDQDTAGLDHTHSQNLLWNDMEEGTLGNEADIREKMLQGKVSPGVRRHAALWSQS